MIRYDKPGCGLSERDGIDLSFDGQVAAALAVADAVGARRFRLFGASQGGQIAASIAARYPERVESLALYGTCASGADLAPAEVRETVVALVRAHWGLGQKALIGAFVSDPTAEDLAGFTRFQRASATAAVAARLLEVRRNRRQGAPADSRRRQRSCTARPTAVPGLSWDARSPR